MKKNELRKIIKEVINEENVFVPRNIEGRKEKHFQRLYQLLNKKISSLNSNQMNFLADNWIMYLNSRNSKEIELFDKISKFLVDVGILLVDPEYYGGIEPVVDTTNPITKKLKITNPELYKIAARIEQEIS